MEKARKGGEAEEELGLCLRLLIQAAREASPPSDDDASIVNAVKRLSATCQADAGPVGIIHAPISKLFQRCIAASVSQHRPGTGLLLLTILQFFLDFGEYVLHDVDASLQSFFKSYLSRQYADPTVAAATLDFLNSNKAKLLLSHSTLLHQYFPLLMKLIAWNGDTLHKLFSEIFPVLMGPSSFFPLFPSILDLPTLVLALEDLERRSGSLLSTNVQKSPPPEVLLALMDEAYTGSSTTDQGGDSGDGCPSAKDGTDALFMDLLKDENDGLAERHWKFPGMAAALQAVIGSSYSQRLKHALELSPFLLQIYFDVAIHDVNESLLCALLPILFWRIDAMFPDKNFVLQAQKACLQFLLAVFQQSPQFIAMLKKPIMDIIAHPYTSHAKEELALQLCWAIGEHGGGGTPNKDAARELFECLELLLYENLSSRRMMTSNTNEGQSNEEVVIKRAKQARLLCFVVTAIAKLATCHKELGPRARVCLAKIARSHQVLDKVIWRRARDCLGLMHETAICSSILGPSIDYNHLPGSVQWFEGSTKAVAHIPFYLLGEKKGPPFHNFSLSDILGS